MNYLGIRGFESILRGGIPVHAEVLLLTPEGPEQFLLGTHWVLEGLSRGERVLAVLSGESPDAFVARLGRMGVDAPSAIASGSLTIVDWYTCWTQPVEGLEEVHRMFRASRKVEDLLAAVDRAIPVLAPATDRRAFVDVLPLALKALDAAGATEALKALRSRLSEAGVTAVFAADRALPEARRDALFPTFHAVLDARGEERDVLSFAVLAVGGVKLAGRYRRARVREDGASVETTPTVRTFSCPICDARVPFNAAKCPSCGTLRAEMSVGTREAGLMDYVETLGREGGVPSARPRPARESRAPGRANGVRAPRPGRVNGVAPGRVNGTAPKGRTNGLASAGRTNGLQAGPGRTNGLVNGLARARSGMTNGLTNGSGFTNGLGGPRARHEAHRTRWKPLFVPLFAVLLLAVPFLVTDPGSPARFSADGSFGDWEGVPPYTQDPAPGTNPAVALTAYRLAVDVDQFALRATVAGAWFADPDAVHALSAFADTDRDPATGYRVQGWGADLLVSVEGSGGEVLGATVREFSGADPHNWSAWTSIGAASAAVSGSELEVVAPWDDGRPGNPVVILFADDGQGSRSYSAVAFGKALGALRANVVERTGVAARGTPHVLDVELEAYGGPVTVEEVAFDVTGATLEPLGLPITVQPSGIPTTLPVRLSTASAATGDLVTVVLRGVVTENDLPVLLGNRTVRAYVESGPSGKDVDGWFWDWGSDVTGDAVQPTIPADLDLVGTAANRTGAELFLFGDVRGSLLAGSPVPVRRSRPVPGGEPEPAPPMTPTRAVGEDVFRAYVDVDRDAPDGVPALGLRGADLFIEVRGIHGAITQRTAYEWRNGWQPIPQPPVATDAHRLEASLPVPAAGAIEVAFETRGWHGPGDSSTPTGTRGVRQQRDTYRADGRVTVTFSPKGRVELSAGGATLAWTLPSPRDGDWALAPTPVGVTYAAPGVEVRYEATDWRLKEDFVFAAPPVDDAIEFPFEVGGGGLLWLEEGSPPEVRAGHRRVFAFEEPYAIDAMGKVTPLALEADAAAGTLRIPLPAELVSGAAYPLTVDPVTSYTLENDGDSNDPGEQLGYSTAIGDFNGDGYADVLTGAPNNNKDNTALGTGHGYAYVWYGPFSADDTSPDVWIGPGNLNSTRFGFSVAAGKFNNDNYWDALVSRVAFDGLAIGNTTIFHGSAAWSGLQTTPDVEFVPPQAPKSYGWFVAAGNVDDANYDDVVISEPGRDFAPDLGTEGVAYVYKSPFAAMETTYDYRLVPSTNANGNLGYAIAIGKIDSDAYADVVVGEHNFNTGDGRLQFYEGSHFTSGSGDISPDATISAPGAGGAGQFGWSLAVGELDGDTYSDVLVGAPAKFSANGRAYAFMANSDGTGLSSGASPSLTLTNQAATERFGYGVLIADWADDGTNDVLIGAPTAPAGGSSRGSVYWFDDPISNLVVDETVSGVQDSEWFGRALAGGRFPNDAHTIVAVGAYRWDDGSDADSGRVVVATVPEPLAGLVPLALAIPLLWRRLRLRRRGVLRTH